MSGQDKAATPVLSTGDCAVCWSQHPDWCPQHGPRIFGCIPSDDIYVYRVRQSRTHPERHVRKAWYGRTWQAEWDNTVWCPRAYTERGVWRKAHRWQRRGFEWRLRHARRMQWFHRNITRRAEYRTGQDNTDSPGSG